LKLVACLAHEVPCKFKSKNIEFNLPLQTLFIASDLKENTALQDLELFGHGIDNDDGASIASAIHAAPS